MSKLTKQDYLERMKRTVEKCEHDLEVQFNVALPSLGDYATHVHHNLSAYIDQMYTYLINEVREIKR